jgi:mannose-6-phosphate isomerase-like protein (cupin superfamily)
MLIDKKPWGEERVWANTENYAAKILIINPGHRLSFQYHNKKEETIYVESGILTITYECIHTGEKKTVEMSEGGSFHVPPGTKHRFSCSSESANPVRLFEVSTPELSDIVRIEDDYGR